MWTYNTTIPSGELYHYGIPGMKWGAQKSQSSHDKYRSKKQKNCIYHRQEFS